MDSLSFWVTGGFFEEGYLGDTTFHGDFCLVITQGVTKAKYPGY